MEFVSQLRTGKIKPGIAYWLFLTAAFVHVAAAFTAALGSSPHITVLLAAPIPFLLVLAVATEQSRINSALLGEIDQLRSVISSVNDTPSGGQA